MEELVIILDHCDTYQLLKEYKTKKMKDYSNDSYQLNLFHDQLMYRVIQLAMDQIKYKHGIPPSIFSFFVMGSAGRYEQGIYSDQDHGIIYEQATDIARAYFSSLGEEISKGLDHVGYEKCKGNVMASNPLWCKSVKEWQEQIHYWVAIDDWKSIRHLLIFMDGRSLVGHPAYLNDLKKLIFDQIDSSPYLIQHMLENTQKIRKGIGFFGQFLVETHGPYTGAINLKETAFFPYVNAVRLLAIKQKISTPSTLERFGKLRSEWKYDELLLGYQDQFKLLLKYRHCYHMKSIQDNYNASHFVKIDHLTVDQKKELKGILQNGYQLHQQLSILLK